MNEVFKHKRGQPFSPQKLEAIKSRLEKYCSLNDANFDYLYELRKIEEEEY